VQLECLSCQGMPQLGYMFDQLALQVLQADSPIDDSRV
jgi:hypothetical protein